MDEAHSSLKKKVILFDIDYTLFDTAEYKQSGLTVFKLYEEIEDMLRQLSPDSVLGILSEGDEEFQKNKLIQTKISHYFQDQHTHIVISKLDSLPNILRKYKKDFVVLVDDRLPILYNAKKILPSLYTVWIKRGIFAHSQLPIRDFTPNHTVFNLGKLKSIVGSLT